MEGEICLIKISNQKVVPALCLEVARDYLLFAQLRKANKEDIFNTQSREKMKEFNKGRPEKDQIKIREKYEINTVFIGKPEGLNSRSVVMVKKLYRIKEKEIIKKIAKVPMQTFYNCLSLIEQVKKKNNKQKELQMVKNKIQLAQINNEKYSEYEKVRDKLLKEIGYSIRSKKKKTTYRNYREVPNKGYIKIYYGGRN